MADTKRESLFSGLSRFPDVEAANLQAWDATDTLLLDTVRDLADAGIINAAGGLAIVGDRYGALTLGTLTSEGRNGAVGPVRVHQDLITGGRALRHNAAKLGIDGGFEQIPFGAGLLSGATVVLLQLPKSLAELEEIADAVARHAAPGVVLLAGGRVKHMSLGMNTVLERHFGEVQPQRARQKSRVLLARGPKPASSAPQFPVSGVNAELGLTVCARGAVFAGTGLDIGTRFLLEFLPQMPAARHAIDLGCGTGILAAMYARSNPGSRVTATDQSAAAVDSARATAQANSLAGHITALQDDAMDSLPPGSADLILLNPPFHVGAAVHAGAGLKLMEAAGRVLAPGGELWTVFNSHLRYRPALERLIGPTREAGRNPKFTVTASVRRPDEV
ncbi:MULTISPECIES: class I SAM-dependent methyltransferase [unclassified Arthrobacter]|uniref:class I SAM-dependent methyltransferase n=1 Tax=unclassified Arthrobacter TaxID=235627 RepID=UPI002E02211A|nr:MULTISPECIES: methyltransferase [unclassified Arthrobacter]MEC5191124.1 16S rRNA (guanine1207-N2)-methyltransferase [Arthrobacter sp. MP_M4]MEC5202295.1 16S rRNA (guanine1207-N2)-methyltransferase [Arthrobacter sp. MP_M7]